MPRPIPSPISGIRSAPGRRPSRTDRHKAPAASSERQRRTKAPRVARLAGPHSSAADDKQPTALSSNRFYATSPIGAPPTEPLTAGSLVDEIPTQEPVRKAIPMTNVVQPGVSDNSETRSGGQPVEDIGPREPQNGSRSGPAMEVANVPRLRLNPHFTRRRRRRHHRRPREHPADQQRPNGRRELLSSCVPSARSRGSRHTSPAGQRTARRRPDNPARTRPRPHDSPAESDAYIVTARQNSPYAELTFAVKQNLIAKQQSSARVPPINRVPEHDHTPPQRPSRGRCPTMNLHCRSPRRSRSARPICPPPEHCRAVCPPMPGKLRTRRGHEAGTGRRPPGASQSTDTHERETPRGLALEHKRAAESTSSAPRRTRHCPDAVAMAGRDAVAIPGPDAAPEDLPDVTSAPASLIDFNMTTKTDPTKFASTTKCR